MIEIEIEIYYPSHDLTKIIPLPYSYNTMAHLIMQDELSSTVGWQEQYVNTSPASEAQQCLTQWIRP